MFAHLLSFQHRENSNLDVTTTEVEVVMNLILAQLESESTDVSRREVEIGNR
jgi:hypothetical protein